MSSNIPRRMKCICLKRGGVQRASIHLAWLRWLFILFSSAQNLTTEKSENNLVHVSFDDRDKIQYLYFTFLSVLVVNHHMSLTFWYITWDQYIVCPIVSHLHLLEPSGVHTKITSKLLILTVFIKWWFPYFLSSY